MKLKELIYGYPKSGVVDKNSKQDFDRVQFYKEYYDNLTPSEFDVYQKDEFIIIKVKPRKDD
jgi:hypothetical protein